MIYNLIRKNINSIASEKIYTMGISITLNNTLVETRLKAMGLTLPTTSEPGGNYVSVNVRANIAYVAIQFPILNGEFFYQGKLGEELNTNDGSAAMQICAVNVLSQIKSKIGFENILGLNHIDVYYTSANAWDDAPIVADAASNLFLNILGEEGKHSRALIGAAHLPRNFCVGLSTSFTLC